VNDGNTGEVPDTGEELLVVFESTDKEKVVDTCVDNTVNDILIKPKFVLNKIIQIDKLHVVELELIAKIKKILN
jgi:hypothetical protein